MNALLDELRLPSSSLARAFGRSIDILSATSGQVIVTGMGKSGLIGRKIAATFSSTGTKSVFVHPGEASHGDMGVIAEIDTVIALSNSGETQELKDVIAYCKRFGIDLIAITAGRNSTLAKAASILLQIPDSQEACGITKAPTTSTTTMLALGDAIAVALLRNKGFSERDFHVFHPGGKLGASLKRVESLMHTSGLPLCTAAEKIDAIVTSINTSGFGCCGVVDSSGKLIGIITDGDMRRNFQRLTEPLTATQLMTDNPHTVNPDSIAAKALGILNQKKITALFVVDAKGHPVGLIHVHDFLEEGAL
ncbi:MAG: KpsF/GutQ family sugar-phosphate isomerase [Pseudomonadota bacterium]